MVKLEAYAIAVVVAVLACIGAYFYGRSDGTELERAKWEKAQAEARDKDYKNLLVAINVSNQIGLENQKAIKGIRVTNTTINREVQREIATNTVYSTDCLPASGILLWNAANRGKLPAGAAERIDNAGVPAASGSGPQGRQSGQSPLQPRSGDGRVPAMRSESKGPSPVGR